MSPEGCGSLVIRLILVCEYGSIAYTRVFTMDMCLLLSIFILLCKWTHSEYLSGFTTYDKEQKERLASVIKLCLIRA